MKGRYEFESEASYNEYLRTYLAGMALQGYLASYAQEDWTNEDANIKHAEIRRYLLCYLVYHQSYTRKSKGN